jgi:signal transduction histidine kinase
MATFSAKRSFFRSRSFQGFGLYLGFCMVVAAGVAWGFYSASLSWFTEHKSEEKVTALKLVDAFVQNYSELRAKFGSNAPVPATFRAHSIELFNKADREDSDFLLRWVGRVNRSIATPPADPAMADTIESFARETDPKAHSEFRTVNGMLVFRTVYPSFAQQQSCVDCHNQIQPEQHWHLGELMGAFSIDVPAGPFIRTSVIQAGGLGVVLLLVLGAAGLMVATLHYRQSCEREDAQEALKESEGRFRDFAASASDWYWEQDEDLRIVYSTSGAAYWGTERPIPKTRRQLVEAGNIFGVTESQLAAHEEDLQARRPFKNFRFQRLDQNGEVRHIGIGGQPIFDGDGNFRGYRGTGRDVTAEITAELELGMRVEERTAELRTAQLELVRREKLSTLGQLTATVAHELRNPLSAIRNTVFAIRESLAGKGIEFERPLSRVDRNIQRCDRIITDLLDFTRMRDLNRAELEADSWLDEVLSEQRVPDGVVLARDFGAAGRRVSFDSERMRRVVINLIENAVQAVTDAASSGGTVTVRTRASGPAFELVIEDTGPGIPAEVLPKVFEPLYSTKSFGTGLGLPTVKQIVEQHGGTVDITSQAGKGTRVFVRIPWRLSREMAA